MGEVRGVDLDRFSKVLLGQLRVPRFEVRHAELRIRECVVGTREHGMEVVIPCLIEFVERNEHAPRFTSASYVSGSCASASRKQSSARAYFRA